MRWRPRAAVMVSGLDHQLLRLVHAHSQLQHTVAERGAEQQQGLADGALGHAAQQEADVLMKPRSNMRSASSSTQISQACSETTLCCLT
jgi:hypothetical protein